MDIKSNVDGNLYFAGEIKRSVQYKQLELRCIIEKVITIQVDPNNMLNIVLKI
jgi:hypothetical protein